MERYTEIVWMFPSGIGKANGKMHRKRPVGFWPNAALKEYWTKWLEEAEDSDLYNMKRVGDS